MKKNKYIYANGLIDLAQSKLGSKVVFKTDESFASANRIINPAPAIFKEGVFDTHGKWMDGWESRRKRQQGHDHCTVRLGLPGRIRGINFDTTYFTGNYAPSVSLEACYVAQGDPTQATQWQPVQAALNLLGDSHHIQTIDCDQVFSHVRLHIYPDGGIARLRIYGEVVKDWNAQTNELVDLAAMSNGGRALLCSNEHFGTMDNILAPGRGINMGDGWETARRRVPGFDWVIVALGHGGIVSDIEVDTAHFKGNFPDSCSIQGAFVEGGSDEQMAAQSLYWPELLASQKLSMDHIHHFTSEVQALGAITHVRLNIFPDGGVSRLRIKGRIVTQGTSS